MKDSYNNCFKVSPSGRERSRGWKGVDIIIKKYRDSLLRLSRYFSELRRYLEMISGPRYRNNEDR